MSGNGVRDPPDKQSIGADREEGASKDATEERRKKDKSDGHWKDPIQAGDRWNIWLVVVIRFFVPSGTLC